MDVFSVIVGAAGALMALILGLFTGVGRFARWIKKLHTEALVETGVIRYLRPDQDESVRWPNGYANLPDTLDGMSSDIRQLQAEHDG